MNKHPLFFKAVSDCGMSFNEIDLELQSLDDAQKQLEAEGRQLEQAIRDGKSDTMIINVGSI